MLLRQFTVVDPASPHNGRRVDLRTAADGTITEVGEGLEPAAGERVVEETGGCAAPGFVDVGAYLGEPGHEERGDVDDLVAAARAGGYVAVATLPNTDPVRQSAADLAFLAGRSAGSPVELLPIAALSKDTAGRDLTDMLELAGLGARLFGDGPGHPPGASLLRRGLEYGRAAGARILSTPYDPALSPEGQVHEGPVSTRMGLRGIPVLSETVPLYRDLQLAAYTGGALVVHLLSSAAGVGLLRGGGAAGAENIWATVSAHHLQFTVDEVEGFAGAFKLLPPLREAGDRAALRAAVADGTIDVIVSNHQPRDEEETNLEFAYAAFGARGLETAFRQCLGLASEELPLARLVHCFSHGPRALLGLPPAHIVAGQPCPLTLFTTGDPRPVTAADLRGRTRNSPLLGRDLPGRILGTVTRGTFHPA